MKYLETLPYLVTEIPNCWIPLASGERLAARLWLPQMPANQAVPGVLDFFIYRKSDINVVRDSMTYAYLAGHGYACIKVDCRGTGDSDGIQTDQFSPQYVDDALESLAWVARQSWCSGKVGMMGLSWPGHMCLQVAARRPPELGAIVPMDAADDRYSNKYHGGCLLHYAFSISTALLGMHARPPNPEHVGARWRSMWRERVSSASVCLERWLAHPDRDAYWRSGSVMERYAEIASPVYASCGLADPGYAVCVPRLLEGVKVPRKVLLGPWAHRMPHYAIPGPGTDFLGEVRRWFDQFLKGVDSGMLSEPMIHAWIYDAAAPATQVEDYGGRWVTEPAWPGEAAPTLRFAICAEGLKPQPGVETAVAVKSPLTAGMAGGEWMPWYVAGNGPELAGDQRADDALSACFDSAPLDAPIDLFGEVQVGLDLAADQAEAQIVLRLCSVAPEGSSRRLAFGVLDLGHREGNAKRLPVEPGKRYRIAVAMLPAACHVPRGHRLRLAISTSYWPMIWPARRRVQLTLYAGSATLTLPLRQPRAEDVTSLSLGEPTVARGTPATVLRQPRVSRKLSQDLASGRTELVIEEDGGHTRIDDRAIEIDWTGRRTTSIHPEDPLTASAYAEWTWKLRFGEIATSTYANTRLYATMDSFILEARVEAREGDKLTAEKTIKKTIPRPIL